MINNQIQKIVCDIFHSFPGNTVFLERGQRHLTIYDEPLIGFADANDPIFDTFKKDEVIGESYMKPIEWLPEAKSVISMFLPFT
ncbi:MAG: epoxyqueuosine reductase, partial [Clostridia bacterium]|nr:epoxyqueuosine reductase [Clostridia bacterium]